MAAGILKAEPDQVMHREPHACWRDHFPRAEHHERDDYREHGVADSILCLRLTGPLGTIIDGAIINDASERSTLSGAVARRASRFRGEKLEQRPTHPALRTQLPRYGIPVTDAKHRPIANSTGNASPRDEADIDIAVRSSGKPATGRARPPAPRGPHRR